MQQELEAFLAARPGVRFIDLLLHDLNGVDRGKRLDVASAPQVFAHGLLLPGSMFALDVPGETVQAPGLGFDEGDADRPCLPVPGTLFEVPWQDHGVAQAQIRYAVAVVRHRLGDLARPAKGYVVDPELLPTQR